MLFPPTLRQLMQQLERLPGIGTRSAQRLALYLLRRPEEEIVRLAESLVQARQRTRLCQRCFFLSEDDLCEICRDPSRDADTICVVADPRDVVAIERLEQYRGLYHVLHGLISPAEGVQPEDLKIGELVERVRTERPREVILATPANVEGDATALYIARLLKPMGVRVTRIAYGMPVGGELDYADAATLGYALSGRQEL
ncbi:MAG: recombination mediator RecR [Fimbriimonadales bacterium]|nr:recombination mediator RecR [Fimbriimonadales bacterium]MDW8051589.1 recombination mediator RecR [Armatimonadota bacterium]